MSCGISYAAPSKSNGVRMVSNDLTLRRIATDMSQPRKTLAYFAENCIWQGILAAFRQTD
ncbi:hypothetical protein CWO84_11185 [Methylomonas sp. Kb3]|nr:hypothetical protein CWO84_11185 [Methylomonas sp. Kb3]